MGGLLIIGAGGHGKVVADTAACSKRWDRIAFLDDRYSELAGKLPWPVLGEPAEAVSYLSEYQCVAIAVGCSSIRLQLLDAMLEMGFSAPVIVHPTAWISPTATLDAGSVVFAQAAIQADACLGRGVIVNTSASIDHECHIADGVHICPGVRLAGEVSVGKSSWLGIGSAVIQQISIGANTTVGAGAVVISNIGDNCIAVGVPARIIEKQES